MRKGFILSSEFCLLNSFFNLSVFCGESYFVSSRGEGNLAAPQSPPISPFQGEESNNQCRLVTCFHLNLHLPHIIQYSFLPPVLTS
jgi:hypothetical protein